MEGNGNQDNDLDFKGGEGNQDNDLDNIKEGMGIKTMILISREGMGILLGSFSIKIRFGSLQWQ